MKITNSIIPPRWYQPTLLAHGLIVNDWSFSSCVNDLVVVAMGNYNYIDARNTLVVTIIIMGTNRPVG